MQNELGKGSFQELDQVAAVKQFTKYAGQAKTVKDITTVINSAVKVGCHPNQLLAKMIATNCNATASLSATSHDIESLE